MSGKTSRWGHLYDYYSDQAVNALFFVAIGVGPRGTDFAGWAPAMGVWTGGSLLLCGYWGELLEQRSPAGTKAYAGKWGFDFDDAHYLLAPLAWLSYLKLVLLGASIVTPGFTVLTGVRLLRLIRRSQPAAADTGRISGEHGG